MIPLVVLKKCVEADSYSGDGFAMDDLKKLRFTLETEKAMSVNELIVYVASGQH